jgi:hypothetical protein|tara:strand:+ start:2088 stop:2384 length:297 start_codon:yes stop_codon:yes gene_type:complete
MKNLKKFIHEELKSLMQDDALFQKRDVMGLEKEEPKDHHRKSSYMAKPQLWQISCQASDLYEMIKDNDEIEDWSESYIAQAAQMINAVYNSLQHKKKH